MTTIIDHYVRCPWCGHEYYLGGSWDSVYDPWFTCLSCGRTMPVSKCATDGTTDTAIFDLPILSPHTDFRSGHYDYWE